jgi:uncharacterized membrane protein YfcA
MFQNTLDLMPLWAFGAAIAVTLVAGFVKGAVGFAMPLLMIAGLSLFLDPTLSVAGMMIPVVMANILQVARFSWDEIKQAVAEFWRYIAIVCVMIVIVAQFLTVIPIRAFYLILGVPVVVLSLIQLMGVQFRLAQGRNGVMDWAVALVAGVLGGLTGTWGVPTVMYLIALDTPKAKQILVQGVIYGLGSISLLAGHLNSGVLNLVTAPFSVMLLIPTYIGMRMGFLISDKLDAKLFRKATLLILILAGVNLIRRGLI